MEHSDNELFKIGDFILTMNTDDNQEKNIEDRYGLLIKKIGQNEFLSDVYIVKFEISNLPPIFHNLSVDSFNKVKLDTLCRRINTLLCHTEKGIKYMGAKKDEK